MQKTPKSIVKKIKITKNDKFLHRTCGQNHHNVRDTGRKTKNKRKNKPLSKGYRKTLKQYLKLK